MSVLPSAPLPGKAIEYLAVIDLVPDPDQPRKTFDPEFLDQLIRSIQAKGVLNPLRVRRDLALGKCVILAGETRWRAAQQAGLTAVPCLVVEGGLSEAERLADQLHDNGLRRSLTPCDEARALARLKDLNQWSGSELAAALGVHVSSVARAMALLRLPAEVQADIDAGRLSAATGAEIARLSCPELQRALAAQVQQKGLTRDAVARAVRQQLGKTNGHPKEKHLACPAPNGMTIQLTAPAEKLTLAGVVTALTQLLRQARQLQAAGGQIEALSGRASRPAPGPGRRQTPRPEPRPPGLDSPGLNQASRGTD